MERVWLNALLANSALTLGLWFWLRRTGFSRKQRFILALWSFFCPVLLPTSVNRLVYLPDFFVPILMWWAAGAWGRVSSTNRLTSALLLISAGLVPAVNSLFYAADGVAAMTGWVNCWRSFGVWAVYVLFCDGSKNGFRLDDLTKLAAWLSVGLALILGVQLLTTFSTNLYEVLLTSGEGYNSGIFDPNRGYWILGMFKAQIGFLAAIFFGIACTAFLLQRPHAIRLVSTMAAAVVLAGSSGSKTSLLCIALVPLLLLVIRPHRAMTLRAGLLFSLLAGGGVLLSSESMAPYLNDTLVNFITSGGRDVQTLDYRALTWARTVEEIARQPAILAGVYVHPVDSFSIGYFHSEYVSVTVLGGLQSLLIYAAALLVLLRQLLRSRSELRVPALIVFILGCFQALSVAHLQPSVLFLSSAGMCMAIYGMGTNAQKRSMRTSFARSGALGAPSYEGAR